MFSRGTATQATVRPFVRVPVTTPVTAANGVFGPGERTRRPYL